MLHDDAPVLVGGQRPVFRRAAIREHLGLGRAEILSAGVLESVAVIGLLFMLSGKLKAKNLHFLVLLDLV